MWLPLTNCLIVCPEELVNEWFHTAIAIRGRVSNVHYIGWGWSCIVIGMGHLSSSGLLNHWPSCLLTDEQVQSSWNSLHCSLWLAAPSMSSRHSRHFTGTLHHIGAACTLVEGSLTHTHLNALFSMNSHVHMYS